MTFKQFLFIVEIRTKIVSVSTYSIALLYVLWTKQTVPIHLAALTFIAALFVDMGTTGFNSYFDWYHNVDDPKFNREDAKVIIHEGVAPGHALAASLLCFGVAAVLGIVIAFFRGLPVIIIGGVCMLVGFLYSAGKRPISFTPWGELFAGGFLGTVFFMITYYILAGTINSMALLVSVPQSLAIAAILSTNNACDFEGDKAAGRKTLAIITGKIAAPFIVYVLEFSWFSFITVLSALNILPLVTLPFAAVLFIRGGRELNAMHDRGFSHETKGPNMGSISKIFMLETAGVCTALILAVFLRA